ncbi:GGDEF domain-containing protein [Paraferrimonas haliotis]|uniref:diguanylate cyclase n=1 Tax=Paraferrimonas haliotis TaxID=2013866 RepID=A0AA37WYH5_9GAMM|nr:GGDEF domain-containing protein [Paraferrimonas haliotis]
MCLCASLFVSAKASALDAIDSQLLLAEKVVSSDSQQFQRFIRTIESNRDSLNQKQTTQLNLLKARHTLFEGDHIRAQQQLHQLLGVTQDPTHTFEARSQLVLSFGLTRQWLQGLQYAEKAMQDLPQVNDNRIKNRGMAILGLFFNQLGLYYLGTDYADKILANSPNARQICTAKALKAEAGAYQQSLAPDAPLMTQAISACQATNENIVLTGLFLIQANQFIAREQPELALQILNRHRQQLSQVSYPDMLVDFYHTLSQAYFRLGFLNQARSAANRAVTIGSDLVHANHAFKQSFYTLYQIELMAQNKLLALEHLQRYTDTETTTELTDAEKQLALALGQFSNSEKSTQIEHLNQQNELLKLQQQLSAKQAWNNRIFSIIFASVTLVLIIGLYRLSAAHKKASLAAITDPLTACYNRRFIVTQGRGLLKLNRKRQTPMAIILLDIDHFKKINDVHGHPIGDRVLIEVANACKKVARSNDLFGRMGGEEFALVLAGCSEGQALQIAELCRQAITRVALMANEPEVAVTASLGVATTANGGYDFDSLLAAADKAMYLAKTRGRNQVQGFKPPQHKDGTSILPEQITSQAH